jgi:hypothetical protein
VDNDDVLSRILVRPRDAGVGDISVGRVQSGVPSVASAAEEHRARLAGETFEEIQGTIRDIPSTVDAQLLIELAFQIPLKRREIRKFEAQVVSIQFL